MSNFLQLSQQVADDFLQTITFIDDEASYAPAVDDNTLDAGKLSEVFAANGKICSIYNIKSESDLDNIIGLSKRSDVVVLDWKINFSKNAEVIPSEENEEDEDETDIRGTFALKIINRIINEEGAKLKLIIIYTGEINLSLIGDNVYNEISKGRSNVNKEEFTITFNGYRIVIFGKGSLKNRRSRPEVEARLYTYEELPQVITIEFVKLFSGLISNVVIRSLAVLRKNTFKLISTFNSSIDPAFLAHRALLNHPSDSEEQILDLIGSEIKSLLKGNEPSDYISNQNIKLYIDQYFNTEIDSPFSSNDVLPSLEIPAKIDKELLQKCVEVGIEKIFIKPKTPFVEKDVFSRECISFLTKLYTRTDQQIQESDEKFALLTCIKSKYNPDILPTLTQGSILKNNKDYWLCIQPKCDSVRIEKTRDFLMAYLVLVAEDKNFDFLLNLNSNYLRFKIVNSIYKSRFFNFQANDKQTVKGIIKDGKIIIKGSPDLEWLGELKSDFAQSISNNFAANLARVGMDHSEWLRRWAKN